MDHHLFLPSPLAPVHTGRRTGLTQEWAAQLSRSLTSLEYLSFISHRPRGLFFTNIGRNSIHSPMCAYWYGETPYYIHFLRYQYNTNDITVHASKLEENVWFLTESHNALFLKIPYLFLYSTRHVMCKISGQCQEDFWFGSTMYQWQSQKNKFEQPKTSRY